MKQGRYAERVGAELQSTSLPFLSTSPLRSSSSQETPLRTTRRPELCQDTFSSLSETTRSSTDSSAPPLLPAVVFSQTSTSTSSHPSKSNSESSDVTLHLVPITLDLRLTNDSRPTSTFICMIKFESMKCKSLNWIVNLS